MKFHLFRLFFNKIYFINKKIKQNWGEKDKGKKSTQHTTTTQKEEKCKD